MRDRGRRESEHVSDIGRHVKFGLLSRLSAAYVANWLASFTEFPPRQKPASFSLDQVMEKLTQTAGAQ